MDRESTTEAASAERVIAYIDGYNLYFGLCDRGWRRYLWLDLPAFIQHLLRPNQVLVGVKYFTTRVGKPAESVRRQTVFLDALRVRGGVEFIFGNFLWTPVECDGCGRGWTQREEKQTDVSIAVHMVEDAHHNRFDTCMLISGDSDQVPAVKHLVCSGKRVVVACPPERVSADLNAAASAHFVIGRRAFAANQLPKIVTNPGGYALCQPVEWWQPESARSN